MLSSGEKSVGTTYRYRYITRRKEKTRTDWASECLGVELRNEASECLGVELGN